MVIPVGSAYSLTKNSRFAVAYGLIKCYTYDRNGGCISLEMSKRTEVTNANLYRIDFGSVVALTIAVEGAMGEAGGIEFSTADGMLFHLNYIHGPVSVRQFHDAFPASPTNTPDLPDCWHELYLGMGNCLYLHERAYQKYLEDTCSKVPNDPETAMLWWRSMLGKPVLTKEECYHWLIENARAAYPEEGSPAELTWCNACRDEINLWTYWQGQGCLSPEILVVGQDWGNPDTKAGKQCLLNIRNGRSYLENNTFSSDKNLAVLFDAALKIDIREKDSRLFFTNLVLGYRTGKTSGALSAEQYFHDLCHFKTLVNILRPRVVICLGQDTFNYALRAFGEKKSFQNGYIAALDSRDNYVDMGGIRFYGMSHCGSYGCKNRGGNAGKGLALQIEDWKEIAKWR